MKWKWSKHVNRPYGSQYYFKAFRKGKSLFVLLVVYLLFYFCLFQIQGVRDLLISDKVLVYWVVFNGRSLENFFKWISLPIKEMLDPFFLVEWKKNVGNKTIKWDPLTWVGTHDIRIRICEFEPHMPRVWVLNPLCWPPQPNEKIVSLRRMSLTFCPVNLEAMSPTIFLKQSE